MLDEELTLPFLFKRALEFSSKAYSLPTIQKETQELVRSAIGDLRRVHNGIASLSLFSLNESLADLATADIAYVLVPYVLSEMQSRISIEDEDERVNIIHQSQRLLRQFIEHAESYSIVSRDESDLARKATSSTDFVVQRETKIQQFKKEKELKAKIQFIQKRRSREMSDEANDFSLIDSLLKASPSERLNEGEDDENLRSLSILVVKLYYSRAHLQIKSMGEELELLSQIKRTKVPLESGHPEASDDTWRLDQLGPKGFSTSGPLMDPAGKPLRPFIILPGTISERARLRDEVFRPSHRLPTMTVDEYLEEEKKRGNIISGGGACTADQITSSEQLILDAEMDGTLCGEVKAEEKRRKDEDWAVYMDSHPKGMGNTMNRG